MVVDEMLTTYPGDWERSNCLRARYKAPVEVALVFGGDQHLPDSGTRGVGDLTEDLGPHRNRAPLENFEVLIGKSGFNLRPRLRVFLRQKDHPNAEGVVRGEAETGFPQQPGTGNGRGHADAVAGFAVGRNSAAMREAGQGRECVLEYVVRRLSRKLRNKPDAAAFGIESGIQQSLVQIGRTMHRETVHCPRRGGCTRWAR